MATPMLETMRRCGSRVEFSAITAKTISPWLRYLRPSLRGMILHCGGKIEETRTRFCEAIPASRRASSNEVSRSLCLPTPLVKKSFFGTMLLPNFDVPSVDSKDGFLCEGSRMSLSHPDGRKQQMRGFFLVILRRQTAGASCGGFGRFSPAAAMPGHATFCRSVHLTEHEKQV